jgi:hypothetical protein
LCYYDYSIDQEVLTWPDCLDLNEWTKEYRFCFLECKLNDFEKQKQMNAIHIIMATSTSANPHSAANSRIESLAKKRKLSAVTFLGSFLRYRLFQPYFIL